MSCPNIIYLAAGSEIGGGTVPVDTSVNANVSWSNEFAPYLGIGWGNAADDNTLDLPIAIGFSLDIGAFYQGSPDVLLTESSGLVPPADLFREQQQLEDSLSDWTCSAIKSVRKGSKP